VAKHFHGLKSDEVLNFSVAITVMRVQRKWRARMRAAQLKRKKDARTARAAPPDWREVVAARGRLMKASWQARQVGVVGGSLLRASKCVNLQQGDVVGAQGGWHGCSVHGWLQLSGTDYLGLCQACSMALHVAPTQYSQTVTR
jgi:hypothetical protein